eukprot:TRINITY_DN2598_c0_g1_i1.p2 TRINITY_DN2598_c0_g1~~TRINITY_DN2598_c0_g1_i1.p2  ORF type:complete len:158 (+),score=8.79 TRINITY_DN2598_c0_g1_i1:433-906(+)
MEYNSAWNIKIDFRNSSHATVSTITLPQMTLNGTENIRATVDPFMMPKLHEMNWKGFGLWAQHEPIKEDTIFDELNYQRDINGNILFQCEDHNCQWRAILTKPVYYDNCVACLKPLEKYKGAGMLCMHFCCCKECFEKVTACPICRKPKAKKGLFNQ